MSVSENLEKFPLNTYTIETAFLYSYIVTSHLFCPKFYY